MSKGTSHVKTKLTIFNIAKSQFHNLQRQDMQLSFSKVFLLPRERPIAKLKQKGGGGNARVTAPFHSTIKTITDGAVTRYVQGCRYRCCRGLSVAITIPVQARKSCQQNTAYYEPTSILQPHVQGGYSLCKSFLFPWV